jgi:TonB family protein
MDQALKLARAEIFRTLEASGSRKSAFGLSLAVHIVLVVMVLAVPLFFTQTLQVRYHAVLLAPPPPEERPILEVTYWKQPTPPAVIDRPYSRPLVALAPPPSKPVVPEPILEPPPVKTAEVRPVTVPEPVAVPIPVAVPMASVPELRPEAPPTAPAKPPVRTNVFGTETASKPTTDLAPREVQTGGFGDPNGVRGKGVEGKAGNIANLGSFDLPVGKGAGNGAGGARGARAVVAGAAFGSALDTTGGAQSAGSAKPDRNVRPGGFADTQPAATSQQPRRRDAEPLDTPAEITFKPRPDYTEEARQSRLEGEVVLRVLFSASGQTRVIDVVRGLGRGLDESAVRAAERIQFKPALRNKTAVDSTAIVHIVFQLAY